MYILATLDADEAAENQELMQSIIFPFYPRDLPVFQCETIRRAIRSMSSMKPISTPFRIVIAPCGQCS